MIERHGSADDRRRGHCAKLPVSSALFSKPPIAVLYDIEQGLGGQACLALSVVSFPFASHARERRAPVGYTSVRWSVFSMSLSLSSLSVRGSRSGGKTEGIPLRLLRTHAEITVESGLHSSWGIQHPSIAPVVRFSQWLSCPIVLIFESFYPQVRSRTPPARPSEVVSKTRTHLLARR